MATRTFTDEELEGLRAFPEIGREELFRFFTLTPADVAFVDPGRGRGPADTTATPRKRIHLRRSGWTPHGTPSRTTSS